MLKNIIFDFDGVIVDSNNIKRKKFFDIFSKIDNSREIVEKILDENAQKNRFFLIRKISKYLNLEKDYRKYIKRYSREVNREIINADKISGAENALEKLSRDYSLFIISGTPNQSLRKIVKKSNLDSYFTRVYGVNDGNKIKAFETAGKEFGINSTNSLYIGDDIADLECAKRFGLIFIGVNRESKFSKNYEIYKLNNLNTLPALVCEIAKKHFTET